MTDKKIASLIHDIYVELYLKATPPAYFDELVANAKVNKFGQKEIPFMDYYLSAEDMDKIINDKCKKVTNYWKEKIKATIYLGCSPTSKKNK
jgi:hypothetical protein